MRSTYPFPWFRRNRSSGLESDKGFLHIASLEDLLDDSSRVFIRNDSELLVSWASSVLVRRRAVDELESKRIDLLWCFVNILARITVIKNAVWESLRVIRVVFRVNDIGNNGVLNFETVLAVVIFKVVRVVIRGVVFQVVVVKIFNGSWSVFSVAVNRVDVSWRELVVVLCRWVQSLVVEI